MTMLLKIRIPLIVTADGKWAANGSSHLDGDPDWSWIDEMFDHENPTIMPQRYFIETVVEIPDLKTAGGAAIPIETKAAVDAESPPTKEEI